MSKLYDILQKIKDRETPKEDLNRQPLIRIRQFLKIRPMFLVLGFLGLTVISGIGLLFLSHYIKSSLSLNKTKNYTFVNQFSSIPRNNISNNTDSLSTDTNPSSMIKPIPSNPSGKPNRPSSMMNKPQKKFYNSYSSSLPSLSYSSFSQKPNKEQPVEGFLLTKEDLLNNLLIMAEEERKKGNYRKAIFYYKNYLKEKKDPWVMNNVGACLIELGDFEEAINLFRKSLSLKNEPIIHYNLIIAYLKKGDTTKACIELKKLENHPDLHQQIAPLKEFCQN